LGAGVYRHPPRYFKNSIRLMAAEYAMVAKPIGIYT